MLLSDSSHHCVFQNAALQGLKARAVFLLLVRSKLLSIKKQAVAIGSEADIAASCV